MNSSSLILFGTLVLACSGANSACAGDNEIIATGIGAAVGGLFGSQIGHGSGQLVSTGLGVAAGGMIGNSIGRDMDREESAQAPSYNYAPTTVFAPIAYNGYRPNYVAPPAPPPAPPTYIDRDTYCRPYSQEIRIDGQIQESFGTACLQPDGTWHIVQ